MFSIKSEKGNTILIMLVILAGVSMATVAMFANSQVNDTSGAHFLKREKALYLSDGTRAFVVQLIQNYIRDNPQADSAALTQALQTALPPLMPSGFTASQISATLLDASASKIIPTGVFKGMMAPQAQVKFSYTVSSNTGDTDEHKLVHSFEGVVDVAQVGLHQFMYFLDLESSGFSPGPATNVIGRMHANGDLCISGGQGLLITKITAAGHVYHSNRVECGVNQTYSPFFPWDQAWVSSKTTPVFGMGASNAIRNDSGCPFCAGTSQTWKDYALSTWNGDLLDSAHSVPKLVLPIPPDIQAQVGASGPNVYNGYSNSQNLRFLVDPVITGDVDAVKKMKYSYQSDIRIIDGVWYLRDKTNPDTWPGKAIWSDHPGHFTDSFNQDVGQLDLKSSLGWATVPIGYSYYPYDPVAKTVKNNSAPKGTVSYGWLYKNATDWMPGQLLGPQGIVFGTPSAYWGANYLCEVSPTYPPVGGALSGGPPAASQSLPFTTLPTCATGYNPTIATALLNGARAGFDDAHIAWYARIRYSDYTYDQNIPNSRSHVNPMNFDVDHFQKALKNTGAGELGSYFAQTGASTDFNGILYITNTWPGSLNGFNPRGIPTEYPAQDDGFYTGDYPNPFRYRLGAGRLTPPREGDQNQINVTSSFMQRSLPFQLCTSTSSSSPSTQPGDPYDQGAPAQFHFVIPECSRYGTTLFSYVNAVRIHNGRHLDTNEFPKGLSLVSNLPVYVLGGYNEDSKADQASSATPWVPALIAGDQITFLSDGWDDLNDPMKIYDPGSTAPYARIAQTTKYNVSIVSGWAMHKALYPGTNESLHTLPALLEDWVDQTLTMNGSVVVGYYPVFYRGGHYFLSSTNFGLWAQNSPYSFFTYRAGNRQISFDQHLELIKNQPPGSPAFYTSATRSWKLK